MKTIVTKTIVFVLTFLLLVTTASYQGEYIFEIPEIFDSANAYMFETDNFVYGYFETLGHDGYIILGPENDCRIVQIYGPHTTGMIDNYYIPCSIDLNKWINRGWIYNFRGNNFLFKTSQVERK